MSEQNHHLWVEQAKKRGLTGALRLTLDLLEPLGPLGAQVLYVLQPGLGIFGFYHIAGEVARTLEEPDGIDELRKQLNSEGTSS